MAPAAAAASAAAAEPKRPAGRRFLRRAATKRERRTTRGGGRPKNSWGKERDKGVTGRDATNEKGRGHLTQSYTGASKKVVEPTLSLFSSPSLEARSSSLCSAFFLARAESSGWFEWVKAKRKAISRMGLSLRFLARLSRNCCVGRMVFWWLSGRSTPLQTRETKAGRSGRVSQSLASSCGSQFG